MGRVRLRCSFLLICITSASLILNVSLLLYHLQPCDIHATQLSVRFENKSIYSTEHVAMPNYYELLKNTDVEGKDLFFVSIRNVENLKLICSALMDCHGFNSNGWLKTHTFPKITATKIDFYVKLYASKFGREQSTRLGHRDSDEYGGRFRLFSAEYYHMMENMKIFIYDVEIGNEMPDVEDFKYGVDQLFIGLLKKSRFNTHDPSKAHFFFLPTRCFAYRRSQRDRQAGGHVAAVTVRNIINWAKFLFPYWNATRGSDHVYICSHDMGGECAQLADDDLHKNAIGLFNTADYSEPWFVPHKDISLPHHPSRGENSLSIRGRKVREGSMERTILAFFAGNLKRGHVRQRIYSLWKQDKSFQLVHGYLTDDTYFMYLSKSKFCLIVRGFRAWSPRLLDAVWFGCIPVIIADWYALPLQGLIEWTDIAVFVPEAQVSKLKLILMSVSPRRLAEMQANIMKVSKHLTWNDPPQPFDAFHSVLFQLWTKRHILRTQLD